MSTTSAPYGLKPLNMLGGRSYTHGIRQYYITSAEAVAIQYGDPVVLLSTGFVQRFNTTVTATTETTAATLLGVFVGCEYPDPTAKVPLFRNFYPGGITVTGADRIKAYVIDDPDVLYQVQANAAAAQTVLGNNISLIQTVVGNSTLGTSGLTVNVAAAATTATLPIRIVDFVQAPNSAVGDAYTDLIVRINTHLHRTTTGV